MQKNNAAPYPRANALPSFQSKADPPRAHPFPTERAPQFNSKEVKRSRRAQRMNATGRLPTPDLNGNRKPFTTQEPGGGDEGNQWHVTDNHSRTGLSLGCCRLRAQHWSWYPRKLVLRLVRCNAGETAQTVWFDLPWSSENYIQANARVYRQGQEVPVILHHLTVSNSLDEHVVKVLEGKINLQEALLNALQL